MNSLVNQSGATESEPRGLKPLSLCGFGGTAEAVPFQGGGNLGPNPGHNQRRNPRHDQGHKQGHHLSFPYSSVGLRP